MKFIKNRTMNFDFAEEINQNLEQLDFETAISRAENQLNKIPQTDFHEIIGKSLTKQSEELAGWIQEFYIKASEKLEIKSLYFEMNEFDINTEIWYIDGFAY